MKNIIKNIENIINFSDFNIIFCGFSGGSDSLSLISIMKELSIKFKFKFIAVHFNHNLRPNSCNDADWCRMFCLNNNIEYLQFDFNIDMSFLKNGINGLESIARQHRINAWKNLISQYSKNNKCVVALAHNSDDIIENLFIRLARGSNTYGLTSMGYKNKIFNIDIIRPLIDYSKNDLIQFLKSINVNEWLTDESNFDVRYKRNFIRNNILCDFYKNIKHSKIGFIKSYKNIKLDSDFIESCALDIFNKIYQDDYINIDYIRKIHFALIVRILNYWISYKLNTKFILKNKIIDRIKQILDSKTLLKQKHKIYISKNIFLLINKNFFSVNKDNIDNSINNCLTVQWNWKVNKEIIFNNIKFKSEFINLNNNKIIFDNFLNNMHVYFDAEKIPEILKIRNWINGDRMIPFAMSREVKLKKIFNNQKIISTNRYKYPILCFSNDCCNDKILWLSGVKRSNYAILNHDTNYALSIKMENIDTK